MHPSQQRPTGKGKAAGPTWRLRVAELQREGANYFGPCWTIVQAGAIVTVCVPLLLLISALVRTATGGLAGSADGHATAPQAAPEAPVPTGPPEQPIVVTLLSSKSLEQVEKFRSPWHDIVLYDYTRDAPPVVCDFCVLTVPSKGVKWAQLDHFLSSEWFQGNLAKYEWLWYPDDDLVFKPGDIDVFLAAATQQSTFSFVQPSLCEGSMVVHPSFAQNPHQGGQKWEHVRTAELQMPLGRTSWWSAIHGRFIQGQTLGMGIDYLWAESLGFEQRCAIFDGVCAYHPDRPEGHRTGRDCPDCHPDVPRTPEINKANGAKFGYPIEEKASGYEKYFVRFRRVQKAPAAPQEGCAAACAGGGGLSRCLGSVPADQCEGVAPEGEYITRWDPAEDAFERGGCALGGRAACCVCLEPDAEWPGTAPSSIELKERGLPFGFNRSASWAESAAAQLTANELQVAVAKGDKKVAPAPKAAKGKAEKEGKGAKDAKDKKNSKKASHKPVKIFNPGRRLAA